MGQHTLKKHLIWQPHRTSTDKRVAPPAQRSKTDDPVHQKDARSDKKKQPRRTMRPGTSELAARSDGPTRGKSEVAGAGNWRVALGCASSRSSESSPRALGSFRCRACADHPPSPPPSTSPSHLTTLSPLSLTSTTLCMLLPSPSSFPKPHRRGFLFPHSEFNQATFGVQR